MKEVNTDLVQRLSDVVNGIVPALLRLVEHWNKDVDGGPSPAADLRKVGQDLIDLGRDLIASLDKVERAAADGSEGHQEPRPTVADGTAGWDGRGE